MDLYRSKAAVVQRLDPVVAALARAGLSPDALTLGAVPVAVLGGLALLASPQVPAVLLVVPAAATTRLVLNLLDGALARRLERSHARGELYNEVGDRLADIALLAPVAFLPGAQSETVLLGVTGAVLASFAGLVPRAAGGSRIYAGILSKPGRMALLSGFSIAVLLLGPDAWWPFGPVLLAGTVLTFIERLVRGIRELP